LNGFTQKIKEENERADDLRNFIERMEEELVKAEESKREHKMQLDELEESMKSARIKLEEVRESHGVAHGKLQATAEKVHVLYTSSCRVFRECMEKQIEIPFRSKDSVQFDVVTSRGHEIDDKPVEELERAFSLLKVDFTALPTNQVEKLQLEQGRKTDVMELRQNIEREYEEQLQELTKELEALNPNMCAPEQHQLEADKLEEIKQQGDTATAKVTELEAKFEACKNERTKRFMKCFRYVESVVAPFYKELTSYDGYEGGSAYLDIDDVEEPYNGGITFTACPPGKRFFPMDLLSGGEKSMASMALLFAMHSYQPPPFMVLDEVDAPFDRKNTDSLVKYLQKLKFQCLVISLKDTFFSNSDSLIGVYKDKLAQTSGVVTLPLRQLGHESGLEAGKVGGGSVPLDLA
jgi:structural maintenance of chromosome 1